MNNPAMGSDDSGELIRVGVVGLGSVGLPLAAAFRSCPDVELILFDRDETRLDAIAAGRAPLAHLSEDVVRSLGEARVARRPDALAECDAVILCVPTPLGPAREPDLSAVRAAATTCAAHVVPGTLIVLESTTWPGTTREVLGEIFAGHGVDLAYSPERVDPGRRYPGQEDGDELGRSVPKLVGGTTDSATERALQLYARAFRTVIPVRTAEIAEAAKLVENVHRAVNIALVGELKIAFDAMGLDVWEVLDAAATKPFGFTRFDPGPGMGGHCLPIDPFYLSWAAKRAGAETRFVELSGEINRAMPLFVATKIDEALASRGARASGAHVLLIGVAYKRGVDIVEESPAFPLAETLEESGAHVSYCDPLVPSCALGSSVSLEMGVLSQIDVCVILVEQDGVDFDLIADADCLVVDTRAALRAQLLGTPRYFRA